MPGFLDSLSEWLSGPKQIPPSDSVPVATSTTLGPDDERLPDTTRPRVARLLSLVSEIEKRSQTDPALVSALVEVRQLRDAHLPQLITSYAEIPPAHRAEIFRQTGRSASYNLDAAVDRMLSRLEALSRSLAQDDIASFADNLRFIEHRYGGDIPQG